MLSAAEGQGVAVTLINGEGAEHDIVFADRGVNVSLYLEDDARVAVAAPGSRHSEKGAGVQLNQSVGTTRPSVPSALNRARTLSVFEGVSL